MDNTTAKYLQPFLLIPNLELKGRLCEREVVWKPLEFKGGLSEEKLEQILTGLE